MSKTTKKIISVVTGAMVALWLVGPGVAYGITADELQAQIDALLAQLAELQAQLASLQGETPAPTISGCTITSFDRNLKQGMSGDDVNCLQIVLNSDSETQLASSGVGSPGNETSYFGPLTKSAVIKFQEKYADDVLASWGLTVGTGFVGSTTRAKLNELLTATPAPTPGPETYDNEADCTAASYFWWDDACHEAAKTASDYTTETECTDAGFYWYDDACNETAQGVVAAGLTIALADDTPASITVPAGVFNQPFTKVNFTAGSEGDISISKIIVTRGGLSQNSDVDLVKIFDGTIQKGSSASLNANNQAVFSLSTPIVVTAGTTKTLTIKVDVASGATSGRTISMAIASADDVTSDASETTGSATGNLMTITSLTIGSLTVAAGANNPSSDLAPEVGDTDVRILQMRLTAGSTENVEITQVIAVENGTAATTDTTNIELYNDSDSESLAVVDAFDAEGRATFDLETPLLIKKGESKTLSVLVDILSGSSRTVSAKVKDSGTYTITAVGKTYGFGVGFASSSWAGTATAQTIAAGALTVTKSSATPATGYVSPGGTAVPLVTFDLEAKGEPVTITEFNNTVLLTTATYDYITGCGIYDEDGDIVAGPVDTTSASDDYLHWTDNWEVPLGVHQYTVKCNLSSSITSGDIQIGFDDSNTAENTGGNAPDVAITAKGSSSNDTITATPASSDVLGNVLTFQVADLDITTLTTPIATSIAPGQTSIHFANIQLSAVSSGEDINITSFGVTDTKVGSGAAYDDIANLKIFSDDIAEADCTGSGRAWDSSLEMCRLAAIKQPSSSSAKTTFTLSTPLVIPKGAAKVVKVYGDYKAGVGAASESHTFDIAAVGDIVAVGASTGTTLTAAMKGTTPSGSGQTMTYTASGSLTTVLDNGRPNSANIAVGYYGTTGITMTKIKLTANYEDISVDYVDLTRTSGGTGADADIAAVYLYEGDTLLAEGVLTTSSKYRFDLTDYTLSKSIPVVWTVKADFNGTLTGATSAYRDAFDLAATTDLVATGLASGTTINASAAVTTQPDMYIYRSVPTFALDSASPSGSLLTASGTEVIRIDISADPAGDVTFDTSNSLRFTLAGRVTDDTVNTDTTITLKNITDGVTLDTASTDVSDIILTTNVDTITFDFSTNTLEIGAGETKVIALELDTSDFGDAGDSLRVSIENAAADLNWSDEVTAAIANNTYFSWLPLKGNTLTTPSGSTD